MSKQADPSEFSDQEFDSIQAAVMETGRGRQFLNEFAQRNRVADTQTLLDAIKRLESSLATQTGPINPDEDLTELAMAIQATGEDICAVRNDMLEDTCKISDDTEVFSSLSNDAATIAKALISTAEALQQSVNDLRTASGDSSQIEALDSSVSSLFESGWRQDVLAQRVTKAMRLLTHLQQNLASFSGVPVAPKPAEIPEFSDENRQYFAQDEELFVPEGGPVTDDDSSLQATGTVIDTTDEASQSQGGYETTGQPDDEIDSTIHAATESEPVETEASNEAPFAPVEPKVVTVRAGTTSADTDAIAGEVTTESNASVQSDDAPSVAQAIPADELHPSPGQEDAGTTETGGNSEAPKTDDVMQAFSDFADATPSLAPDFPAAPQPEMTASAEEKERIVIIRKSASDKAEIPFADYLGLDDGHDPAKDVP